MSVLQRLMAPRNLLPAEGHSWRIPGDSCKHQFLERYQYQPAIWNSYHRRQYHVPGRSFQLDHPEPEVVASPGSATSVGQRAGRGDDRGICGQRIGYSLVNRIVASSMPLAFLDGA